MNKATSLFVGIILALCFTACTAIMPPPAGAEITRFAWDPVTVAESGDPIVTPVHYRVHCDTNTPVEAGVGVTGYSIADSLPADAADGPHNCTFTAHLNQPCSDMTTGVCESGHSNVLNFLKRGLSFFAGEEPVVGSFRFE